MCPWLGRCLPCDLNTAEGASPRVARGVIHLRENAGHFALLPEPQALGAAWFPEGAQAPARAWFPVPQFPMDAWLPVGEQLPACA